MSRPFLLTEPQLKRMRHRMRFEGLTSWQAAKVYPYSNHSAAYRAMTGYEERNGLTKYDREEGADVPLDGEE